MKCKFSHWLTIYVDLSDETREVSDYVLDQLEDRINDEVNMTEIEIDKNYNHQFISFSDPIIDLIQRIIEEKQADMEWEQKHGQT